MIDSAFGHWLAGFIDGEGCFFIDIDRRTSATNVAASGAYCRCEFSIELRGDDVAILREIQRQTGIGKIRTRAPRGNSKLAHAVWAVRRISECLALEGILNDHPLRAKKARDYEIWREGLAAQTTLKGRARHERLLELRAALRAARVPH